MDDELEAKRKALRLDLDRLNKAVDLAITERTAWMDAHMEDFAIAKPGEVLYQREGDNFTRLGVVRKLYRFQRGQNILYDTGMSVEYEYQSHLGSNMFANTSGRGYIWLGSEADKEAHEKAQYESPPQLKSKFEAPASSI